MLNYLATSMNWGWDKFFITLSISSDPTSDFNNLICICYIISFE